MTKTLIFTLLAGAGLISACAEMGAGYTPILDGKPTPQFERDLDACQTLARDQSQFTQETAAASVLGAGAGAVVGAFDDDTGMAGGAIAGALAGGVAVAVDSTERRKMIVIECMRGRGHRVVG